MREITQTIYTINELSDNAKAVAHQNWLDINCDFNDLGFATDDIIELGNCIGINIDKVLYTGFCSQGDGLCFTGDYEYKPTWNANLEGYAPMAEQLFELGQALEKVYKEHGAFSVDVSHIGGNYYHENSVDIDYVDDDLAEQLGYDVLREVSVILRQFMQYSYRLLEAEQEYQSSLEYFMESSLDNEYEYYQNGRQYF